MTRVINREHRAGPSDSHSIRRCFSSAFVSEENYSGESFPSSENEILGFGLFSSQRFWGILRGEISSVAPRFRSCEHPQQSNWHCVTLVFGISSISRRNHCTFNLLYSLEIFTFCDFLVASKTLQSYFDGNSHFSRGYSIISTFTFSNSLALTVVENKKSYLTLMLIATLFSFATVHVELQNQNKAFVVWRPQPNPDVSIFSPS